MSRFRTLVFTPPSRQLRTLLRGTKASSAMALSSAGLSSAGLSSTGLAAMALPSLLALSMVGCAESDSIIVIPGPQTGDGGSVNLFPSNESTADCNADQLECGTGCCASGAVCSETLACVPTNACEEDSDCTGDSYCPPGGGTCAPWGDETTSPECRNGVQLAGIVPSIQCQWPGPLPPDELPNSIQVLNTPMVVDFNLDGDPSTSHPSIVFVSYASLFSAREDTALRIIDGEDCSLQFTIPGGTGTSTDNPYFIAEIAPALGDINNDGLPDIVAATNGSNGPASTRNGLRAFSLASGAPVQLWGGPQTNTGNIGGIAIHDLDNDDSPEILTAKSIFNSRGSDLFSLEQGNREPPMVMNIMDDPAVELISNQGVKNWNAQAEETRDVSIIQLGELAPLWSADEKHPNMFVAAADLITDTTQLNGGADSVEIIMVGVDGEIIVTKADGVSIHRVEGRRQAGGPPIIADFDGDGRMEFASAGLERFTVYDLDCRLGNNYRQEGCSGEPNEAAELWSVRVQSEQTAASVFDFDGDGRAEVVYADQCFLRTYDGQTGRVLFSVPRSSLTKFEYPVVADVDGDSFSELVTSSNDANQTVISSCAGPDPQFPSTIFAPSHGITVWSDPNDLWAGSRPIWNQHTYNVNNVHDNGTIPSASELKNSWNPRVGGGPNTFRQNVQGETGATVNKPDLTVAAIAEYSCVSRSRAVVSFNVCNRGLEVIQATEATANLFQMDAAGATQPLSEASARNALAPGQCEKVDAPVELEAGGAGIDILVRGDSNGQVDECVEENNEAMISNVRCEEVL